MNLSAAIARAIQHLHESGVAHFLEMQNHAYANPRCLFSTMKKHAMIDTEKGPVCLIHPGSFLSDELQKLNMSGAELARQLHVPSNRIYQLLSGKRAMTADTALRLEQWLGIEADFWMKLQSSYELDRTAEILGEKIKKTIHRRRP